MKSLITAFVYLVISSAALAAPGAHGPNGEHLDAPAGHIHTDAGPRIETFTESFELVGQLHEGELSILIDRYETNEPVLSARLDAELNGIKAPAKFHADHGDYAIDDPRFIEALSKPGKHALLFTLVTADESDLLEGTLEVSMESPHDHRSMPWIWIGAGLLASLILMAVALRMSRSTSSTRI